MEVDPSENVTVPVGLAVPDAGVTVAVKATLLPAVAVDTEADSVVVVATGDGAVFTVITTGVEVLPLKSKSPLYTAVMLSEPAGSALVEYWATPDDSVPVPSDVVPFRNVTVPVGVAALPAAPVTLAVSVTLDPTAIVVADTARAVVLATGVVVLMVPYKFNRMVFD